jgi:hypothetical protein
MFAFFFAILIPSDSAWENDSLLSLRRIKLNLKERRAQIIVKNTF